MSIRVMTTVWYCDLPTNQKIVLLAYADHAKDDGSSVFPAVETVAKKCSYSKRTVQRVTRELEAEGFLIPDGAGPKGVKRWRIDLEKLEPRQNVTPVNEEVENAEVTDDGDNDDTKNAQMSSEPSINHQESSVKPSIKQPVSNALRKHAEVAFTNHTGLRPPDVGGEENGKRWWNPLREICREADYDEDSITHLIIEACERNDENDWQISAPGSIMKSVRAIASETRSGRRKKDPIEQYEQERGVQRG